MHIDFVVEVILQAVFQFDALALVIRGNGEVEKSFVDDFVVVFVLFALVKEVDLQCQKRELQCLGYESECLGCVLLFKPLRIFPPARSKCFLDKPSLSPTSVPRKTKNTHKKKE